MNAFDPSSTDPRVPSPSTGDRVAEAVNELAQNLSLSMFNTINRTRLDREQFRIRQAAIEARLHAWQALHDVEVRAFCGALEGAEMHPGVRLILDHHAPDYYVPAECSGCDGWSNEYGGPPWPCTTVALIAELHGIPVPVDYEDYCESHPIPED